MRSKIRSHISPAAIAIALFFAWALFAHGAIIRVTTPNDSGAGALRQAFVDTTDGDTITSASQLGCGCDHAGRTAWHLPFTLYRVGLPAVPTSAKPKAKLEVL